MKILLSAINAKYIHSNPGVYSLKAYSENKFLKKGLYAPDILIAEHTINNHPDDILEDLYVKKPELIGFSCYIWNISYINSLIPELKKLLPDTCIWVGGPEVSYRAESYLKDMNGCVAGVIVGEGEESFYQIAKVYSNLYSAKQKSSSDNSYILKQLSNISGIVYLDGQGNICQNECANGIALDDIPFIYDSLDDFSNRIIYYESSRGCPFSCSYCLSSIDKSIRFRSMELVKKELDFFLEHKASQVKFIDRTFNCNPNRAYEIWEYIHSHDNGVTNFHFEIAADLLTPEQIDLLKDFRPGLAQFEIGVQTTNLDVLREIKRVSDLDRLRKNVARIRLNNNIHQHLDLIAGLPNEDYSSFVKSFNDVYSMRPDQLQLGFLKVLSGSYIGENALKYDIEHKNYPPYEVIRTKDLDYDEILTLKRVEAVVEIFYNSSQFHNSVLFLERFFDSAFDLYHALGDYYYTNYDTKAKHSRIARYELLLGFYRELISREAYMNTTRAAKNRADILSEEAFISLLTLDIYLRENMKKRPDFSLDLKPYQAKLTNLRKQLSLPNSEHIEVFKLDSIIYRNFFLPYTKTTMDFCSMVVYIHFDYNNRNPLTMDAKLNLLEVEGII